MREVTVRQTEPGGEIRLHVLTNGPSRCDTYFMVILPGQPTHRELDEMLRELDRTDPSSPFHESLLWSDQLASEEEYEPQH